MKKFAIYLPQFHEIEENNLWWGKGFTEWTNVKSAQKLYDNHIQPQIPLEKNYYNLLDKKTVEWQTNIANKYGVDGFVYYHYYFEGKLIMEKPAENILNWKDINQKFFFCWANHTWLKGHSDNREVLIEQTYGDETSWEKHFDYLLPFFKDDRYEKCKNKPMFMIYMAEIPNKKEMFDYFDRRCKENGFDGLYIVETYMGDLSKGDISHFIDLLTPQSEMIYLREPNMSVRLYMKKNPFYRLKQKILKNTTFDFPDKWVAKISGNKLFNLMTKYYDVSIGNRYLSHGVFFTWDNTPRHGKRGYIITEPDEDSFKKYASKMKDQYIFINAWNEWAEGMMLEPTENNKFMYLEWINKYMKTLSEVKDEN